MNTKVFAARVKDSEVLMRSSSGGMFTALSDAIFRENGAVACAVYDYEELLCDLIARVADGGEEILLCQRDRDRISLLRFLVMVNNKLKLEGLDTPGLLMSDEVLEADGGFVLKKGDITVNCSLKMLLSEKREVLEGSLAAILCKE